MKEANELEVQKENSGYHPGIT